MRGGGAYAPPLLSCSTAPKDVLRRLQSYLDSRSIAIQTPVGSGTDSSRISGLYVAFTVVPGIFFHAAPIGIGAFSSAFRSTHCPEPLAYRTLMPRLWRFLTDCGAMTMSDRIAL